MEKFGTIYVKCRPGKTIFYLCSIFILAFILHIIFAKWFSQYTEIDAWFWSVIKSWIIYCGIVFVIIILVIAKKNTNKYYVYCFDKIVSKNGKRMQYENYTYTQTFLQKCFGLVSIKFYGHGNEKILFKDVSNRILYYL